MAATIPSSTSVIVTGGWGGYVELGVWRTPTVTHDLADYSVTGRNVVFANPFWYGFYWLAMDSYENEYVTIGGGGTSVWFPQYATAVEVEQGAMAGDCWQLHVSPPWDYGPMLGCVILRNNGNTTEANQFMPIDPVNRGRSYIWWTHDKFVPVGVGA